MGIMNEGISRNELIYKLMQKEWACISFVRISEKTGIPIDTLVAIHDHYSLMRGKQ